MHLAIDGRFAGVILIADEVRPEAREALAGLEATVVKRIVMLTSDNAPTAQAIATQVGVDEVHAELLPEGKVAVIAELQKPGAPGGDGGPRHQRCPALVRADVGIAMGGAGTQAALEAAPGAGRAGIPEFGETSAGPHRRSMTWPIRTSTHP